MYVKIDYEHTQDDHLMVREMLKKIKKILDKDKVLPVLIDTYAELHICPPKGFSCIEVCLVEHRGQVGCRYFEHSILIHSHFHLILLEMRLFYIDSRRI